jgi:amino acid permease
MEQATLSIEKKINRWSIARAGCMIAGTAIGAGMLGIPAVTSPGGFIYCGNLQF